MITGSTISGLVYGSGICYPKSMNFFQGSPMVRIALLFLAVLVISCGGTRDLTPADRAKLTPGLVALLTEESVPDELYDVSVRPDGTKEYGIIVRAATPDELRAQGIKVQSALGDVITVRVSKEQLRVLLSLPSVRSLDQGNTNQPHK